MKINYFVFIIILIILSSYNAFSFGHKEKPNLNIETTGPVYLSPNEDGIQDTAKQVFKVTIKVKSKEGYVPKYGIILTDASGNTVKEVIKKEKSDVNWFFSIFRGYDSFTLEKSIDWDGKGLNDEVVPDGTYEALLWVKDDAGNRMEQTIDKFIVDTTKPEATINLDYNYFSPNNDGNQDTMIFKQKGSYELKWEAQISDSEGNKVKSHIWTESSPQDFIWDGKKDDGTMLNDGKYSYTLSSADLAGNKSSFNSGTIILDTRETPINLTLTSNYISPNGDRIKEDTIITPQVNTIEGLENWQIGINDQDGNIWEKYQGQDSNIPPDIFFNGYKDNGDFIGEGTYQVSFEVKYIHGNNPVISVPVTVDLTKPQTQIVTPNPYFSPNGDGMRDTITVQVSANEPVMWRGSIYDSNNKPLKEISVANASESFIWDGTDEHGNIQPEGIYKAFLNISDLAGNSGADSPNEAFINIDNTPPEVYLSLKTPVFSPNGDKQKDSAAIEINTNEPVEGKCNVEDGSGNQKGSFSVSYDESIAMWDGKTETGEVVVDGTYIVVGNLNDQAGNKIKTGELSVVVDNRPTNVKVNVPKGFSPNGDGTEDKISIDIIAELPEGIDNWSILVEQATGETIKTISGDSNLPEKVEWNGQSDTNETTEGMYYAKLRVKYKKGDIAQAKSANFRLDITPPEIDLKVTSSEPEEETVEEELYITLDIKDDSEIKQWMLDVTNHLGEIMRSYSGEGNPEDDISWNAQGKTDKPIPPEDTYTMVVEVEDIHGNKNKYRKKLPLDIQIVRIYDKLYLMVPNIIFGAYKYKLDSAGEELYKRNIDSIKKAAKIYQKFPNHSIGLEAHALNIFLNIPGKEKNQKREEKILFPLTERRANTVMNELIKQGINKKRIDTLPYGGSYPIVPVDDKKIRWKNRRVEFILIEP